MFWTNLLPGLVFYPLSTFVNTPIFVSSWLVTDHPGDVALLDRWMLQRWVCIDMYHSEYHTRLKFTLRQKNIQLHLGVLIYLRVTDIPNVNSFYSYRHIAMRFVSTQLIHCLPIFQLLLCKWGCTAHCTLHTRIYQTQYLDKLIDYVLLTPFSSDEMLMVYM